MNSLWAPGIPYDEWIKRGHAIGRPTQQEIEEYRKQCEEAKKIQAKKKPTLKRGGLAYDPRT